MPPVFYGTRSVPDTLVSNRLFFLGCRAEGFDQGYQFFGLLFVGKNAVQAVFIQRSERHFVKLVQFDRAVVADVVFQQVEKAGSWAELSLCCWAKSVNRLLTASASSPMIPRMAEARLPAVSG